MQHQQVLVAADDVVGPAFYGHFQEYIIARVAADLDATLWSDGLAAQQQECAGGLYIRIA